MQLPKSLKIPEIRKISTGKIIVDNSNPNVMSDKAFASLKRNIERYGFLIPVITNKELKIADGFHRWKAARELGMTEVPVIALDIDEVDRRMLRQILNKLRGEHDLSLDAVEYQFLLEQGQAELFEELSTISMEELNACINEVNPIDVKEDEFVPDLEKPPRYIVNKGDVYTLGNHRLMCGDSTVKEDVDVLMSGKSADMVFTDPPYGINYQDLQGSHDKIKNDDSLDNLSSLLRLTLSLDCPQFICCNWKCYSTFEAEMIKAGKPPKACIVWDKGSRIQNLDKFGKQHEFILYHGPFGGEKTIDVDIWSLSRETRKDHPTAKPVELCARGINSISGINVVDLFGGSGSTLIACEQLNRKCYMMELDPKYCSVIIERWEQLTKNKAERVESE